MPPEVLPAAADNLPASPATAESEEDDVAAGQDVGKPAGAEASDQTVTAVPSGIQKQEDVPEESKPAPVAGPDNVLEALKKLGVQHDFKSGEDALKSFVELRRKIGERDEMAEIGRRVAPLLPRLQEALGQEAGEDEEVLPFDPPTASRGDYLEMQKPEDQRDGEAVKRVAAQQGYIRNKWQEWVENPYSLVNDLVMPTVHEFVQKTFEQREAREVSRKILEAESAVVQKYHQEIKGEINRGVPLQAALELVKLRHGAGGQSAKSGSSNLPSADAAGGTGNASASEAAKARDLARTKVRSPGVLEAGASSVPLRSRTVGHHVSARQIARAAMAEAGINLEESVEP